MTLKKNRLLFCCCSLLTFSSIAQKSAKIGEVEISTPRGEVEFVKAARNVILITRKDIEESAATSINEVLEYAAGVDIRQRGQQGVQADLSIRGSSFEQVVVLLNGIKMTDPQTGHHALNLPISLLDIERIEILHGGAARIYGPGAFAGAVNIITKTPVKSKATTELMAGQFGLRQVGVSAAIVEKIHNHRVSLQNQSSDGFARNTDYASSSIFWESNVQLKNVKLSANVGQNSKAFGAQNFYTANFPEQFEATKAQFASLSSDYSKNNFKLKTQAYHRKHNDRFELFREEEGYYRRTPSSGFVNNVGDSVSWYNDHNYHETKVYGAELSSSFQSKFGKISLGYDFRREEVVSNNLGKNLTKTIKVKNEVPSAFYTKADDRENHNLYLEHSFSNEVFFISGGVLYNINSDFDDGFYPGIEVAYQLDSNFRVYASADKSFRFPSFTDLYYDLGGAMGSEGLSCEKSMNYEIGLKLNRDFGYGHAGFFRRDGSNLIDWVRLNGSVNTQATNLTNVTLQGFEVDYYMQLNRMFAFKAIENIKFSYSYIFSENKSSGFESKYVLDFLRHKADLGLKVRLNDNFVINWNTSIQDRRGEYVDAKGNVNDYKIVMISNVKLSTQQKSLNVYLQASNVFNQEYVDIGNVQNPGRWFSAGLKYQIDFKN